jgi:hypothetical protein
MTSGGDFTKQQGWQKISRKLAGKGQPGSAMTPVSNRAINRFFTLAFLGRAIPPFGVPFCALLQQRNVSD